MNLICSIRGHNIGGIVNCVIQSRQRQSYFVVFDQDEDDYLRLQDILKGREEELGGRTSNDQSVVIFKPSKRPEYDFDYSEGMTITKGLAIFEMHCAILSLTRLRGFDNKTVIRIQAEGKFNDISWVFSQISETLSRKILYTSNSNMYRTLIERHNLEKAGLFISPNNPKIEIPLETDCNSQTEKPNEVKTMKTENIASLMIEGLRTVSVEFAQGPTRRPYTYKTLIEDIEVDDVVVVYVSGVPKCAHVIGVDKTPKIDVDSNTNYKWIVCKVDETEYEETKKREKEFADHLLELQQKNVVQNATVMLAEKLGIEKSDLDEAKKILQVTKNTNNESN